MVKGKSRPQTVKTGGGSHGGKKIRRGENSVRVQVPPPASFFLLVLFMSKFYEDDGIQFLYPDSWTLEREENENGWSITVQSPGTAFILIICDQGMPDSEELADATLEALKNDYPELEYEPVIENLCGQPAVGHNIQFFSLDLGNSCKTRCVYSQDGTILVMTQSSDIEHEKYGPAMQALSSSLRIDEE